VTATHRRAARRELEAARILQTERVHRRRYQRAPDVRPVRLDTGDVLTVEVKTRGKLPAWLVGALAQAERYLPGGIPVVALSATGGPPLAVLPLADLARLLGLQPREVGQQLPLAA